MNWLLRNHFAQDGGAAGTSFLLAVAEVVGRRWDDPGTLITILGLLLLIVRAATEHLKARQAKGCERVSRD